MNDSITEQMTRVINSVEESKKEFKSSQLSLTNDLQERIDNLYRKIAFIFPANENEYKESSFNHSIHQDTNQDQLNSLLQKLNERNAKTDRKTKTMFYILFS